MLWCTDLNSLKSLKLVGEGMEPLFKAPSNDNFLANSMDSACESLAYARGTANDQDAVQCRRYIYLSKDLRYRNQ